VWFSLATSLLSQLLLIVAIVGSIWYRSLWPLVGFGAFLLASFFLPAFLPATPTTAEKAAKTRKRTTIGLVLFVLAVIAAGVFYGP